MSDTKPRLVVIDDNQAFLNQLEKGLAEYFVATLVHLPPNTGIEQVEKQVRGAAPDHLVLDVNLSNPTKSKELLRHLLEQGALPDNYRIWLISQAGSEDSRAITDSFQRIDARVESRLLPKPITPMQLWAELTEESCYEPEPPWDNFPLPFRVLSARGKVLFYNGEWKNKDYPEPSEFLKPEGELQTSRRDYTGSFRGEAIAGFTLHSFPMEQDDQRFLAQVAEVHPLDTVPGDLDEVLDRIFTAMRLAGFNHGRFYRVRPLAQHQESEKYDKVLELTRLSYEPPSPISLPYRLALDGMLKKRLESYTVPINDDAHELIYKIRTLEEDKEAQDPRINKLNNLLGLLDIISWLEVPIWLPSESFPTISDEGSHKAKYDIGGWLFFDRRPLKGESTISATDPVVTKENVEPIKPLLLSLVALLKSYLKQERLTELWEYERRMRSLDQELMKKRDTQQRFFTIIQALRDLGEASCGVLVLEDETMECLKVWATSGEKLPGCIVKLCLPLDANHHPIVRAWSTGVASAWQEYDGSESQRLLLEGLGAGKAESYLRTLTEEETGCFRNWVKDQIKALLAIPITLPGEVEENGKCIGGITLQFAIPLSITRCRMEKIEAVLQRARWVIQQHFIGAEERMWLWNRALGHELKGDLNAAVQELEELAYTQDLEKTEEYRCARLWVLQARDLAENLMDFGGHRLELKEGSFSPQKTIQEYLALVASCPAADQAVTKVEPEDRLSKDWNCRLKGDEQVFGRVVRVLLGNAFKFGKAHQGLGNDQTVPVSIYAAIEKSKDWTLTIINPGRYEENGMRGSTEHPPPPGAGIGLKVAVRWTKAHRGKLSLENVSGENAQVRARLTWPIASDEGENNGR